MIKRKFLRTILYRLDRISRTYEHLLTDAVIHFNYYFHMYKVESIELEQKQ